jgi:hypothetical protein
MSPPTPTAPLAGITIWLSGSVPERQTWGHRAFDVEVRDFVAYFTSLVLKRGGSILQGANPAIRAVLLEEARSASEAGLGRDRITLAVSKTHREETSAEIPRWRAHCRVVEIDAVQDDEGQIDQLSSLDVLRQHMAAHAQAYVGVGGRWWNDEPGRTSLLRELELARARGLPCFLIGGLGGTASLLSEQSAILAALNNGLSLVQNQALLEIADIEKAAGKVVVQLCALFSQAPGTASAVPAHALYVELATRITTQRLHYRSGDEENAAKSLHSLFQTTRELMTEHPKAREFHRVALALLKRGFEVALNGAHEARVAGLGVEQSDAEVGADDTRVVVDEWLALIGVEFERQAASQNDLLEAIQERGRLTGQIVSGEGMSRRSSTLLRIR